jgi:hypothetical protein
MLLCSSYILNHTEHREQWKLHPWCAWPLFRTHGRFRASAERMVMPEEVASDKHGPRNAASFRIHNSNNNVTDGDMLREVRVPDTHPAERPIRPGCLSMCAGDFVEVYSKAEQVGTWDAVTTCFFIDTAHNILEYLEIISNLLKEGGAWINLGPLLFHWSDAHTYLSDGELSVEVSAPHQ